MTTEELLAQVRSIEIKTKILVNQAFSGEYHSAFKGRGMEFAEVREYIPGDDVRNIDWNVTAKFGHPYVKVLEEERELNMMIAADLSGSLLFGSKNKTKQQTAAELCALFAFAALKNKDKTGLLLFTDAVEKFVSPHKGEKHTLRLVRDVLSFEPKGKSTNIKGALEYMNNALKKKSIIFLISDFLDEGYENVLKIVAQKHDLICINLYDQREYDMPDLGIVSFKDPETGELIWFDSSSQLSNTILKEKHQEHLNKLHSLFTSAGIDYINIKNGDDFVKPIIKFFNLRERRW